MNSKPPIISVLICTFNRSQILQRAIQSVLTQTFTDLELIIIDDCSTDGTHEIIRKLNDHRVRYFRNDINVGSIKGDRAHIQRFVYELMRGKYFIYLCDDDYWINPNLLKEHLDGFKKYENVAMVIGGQLSHFISTCSDFSLLPPQDISPASLNTNGCFSWHNDKLAYVMPNNSIIEVKPVNSKIINNLLETQKNNQQFTIKNNIPVFSMTNEDLSAFILKPQQQAIHNVLPDLDNLPKISYKHLHKVPIPRTVFIKNLYEKKFMTSKEFLKVFSDDPANHNIIVGATLYSREHFILSGAMFSDNGSKWQAGYEFLMGPACTGNVVYLDKPCIVVEVRASNASFQGTQLDHYLDCLMSIRAAFKIPMQQPNHYFHKHTMQKAKKNVIRNITRSFLSNSIRIKLDGSLSACNQKNMDEPVLFRHALKNYLKNKVWLTPKDLGYFCILQLPPWGILLLQNPKAFVFKQYQKIKNLLHSQSISIG